MGDRGVVVGLAELPRRGRVWLSVGACALVVGAAVGIKMSGDAFAATVPWSERTDRAPIDPAALSFTTHELATSVEGDGDVLASSDGPLHPEGAVVTLTARPAEGAPRDLVQERVLVDVGAEIRAHGLLQVAEERHRLGADLERQAVLDPRRLRPDRPRRSLPCPVHAPVAHRVPAGPRARPMSLPSGSAPPGYRELPGALPLQPTTTPER